LLPVATQLSNGSIKARELVHRSIPDHYIIRDLNLLGISSWSVLISSEIEKSALTAVAPESAQAISKRAGKKTAKSGASAQLPSGSGGGGKAVVKADWKESFKKKQVGVSDMTLLSTVSNEAINENLRKRFESAEIYVGFAQLSLLKTAANNMPLFQTYIAHVLISVNPFRDLGIYTPAILSSYRGKNRLEVPPHVFAIAESSYYNMNSHKENQCVIISGESGAGKTEAAKRIMQYIAAVSADAGGDGGIEGIREMVLATNPLLESFGCAKTLRNDNSSRHVSRLLVVQANGHDIADNSSLCAGKVSGDYVQLVWAARRSTDHQLPVGEGKLSSSLLNARAAHQPLSTCRIV